LTFESLFVPVSHHPSGKWLVLQKRFFARFGQLCLFAYVSQFHSISYHFICCFRKGAFGSFRCSSLSFVSQSPAGLHKRFLGGSPQMFFTFVSQRVLVRTYSEGSPICCVRLSLSFLLDSVLREFSTCFIASLTPPLCDAVGVFFGLSFSNTFSAQGALKFECFIYIQSDCLLLSCWVFVSFVFLVLFVLLMFFLCSKRQSFVVFPFRFEGYWITEPRAVRSLSRMFFYVSILYLCIFLCLAPSMCLSFCFFLIAIGILTSG